MKIAIYGLPTAGKDTFINHLQKRLVFKDWIHVKGSQNLQRIATERFQKPFSELSNTQKDSARLHFLEELSTKCKIFVDGHYSFKLHNEQVFDVCTDQDIDTYDLYVYLRVDSSEIQKRIAVSSKNKKFSTLSVEEIEEWQEYEIAHMRRRCFNHKKEFIVLQEEINSGIDFIQLYIQYYPKYSSLYIAQDIIHHITHHCDSKCVALLDCDKTICTNDISVLYLSHYGIERSVLKKLFRGDYYTAYQLYQFQTIIKQALQGKDTNFMPPALFNDIVTSKMEELHSTGYTLCGITAGVGSVWEKIFQKYDIIDLFFSAKENIYPHISIYVKGYIAKLLQEQNIHVVAIGDSILDIIMLENANKGYIYAPGKLSQPILSYLAQSNKTNLVQFRKNPFQYPGIKAVN